MASQYAEDSSKRALEEAVERVQTEAFDNARKVYITGLRRFLRVEDEKEDDRRAMLEATVEMLIPDLNNYPRF